MLRDPVEQDMKNMSKAVGVLAAVAILAIFLICGALSFMDACSNETKQDEFGMFLDNVTVNTTTHYQNITVLDKEHKNRAFRGDVYNVVYEDGEGDIQLENNMTLYYSVEKGHSYNVSGTYCVKGIVGEI